MVRQMKNWICSRTQITSIFEHPGRARRGLERVIWEMEDAATGVMNVEVPTWVKQSRLLSCIVVDNAALNRQGKRVKDHPNTVDNQSHGMSSVCRDGDLEQAGSGQPSRSNCSVLRR